MSPTIFLARRAGTALVLAASAQVQIVLAAPASTRSEQRDSAAREQAVPAASSEPIRPLFREIGARALPGVATTSGSPDKNYIVEVNGGGLLTGDYDGDGAFDLVLVDGSTLERVAAGKPGLPPRMFLGNGKAQFAPAGESWAMSGGRWGMGGAAGDVDGDGWLDFMLTEWGPDRLFLNQGGRGLAERTEQAGFLGERWGTSAAFFDADRDGVLDLYVVNYLSFDPSVIPSAKSPDAAQWKGHPVMSGPEGLVPVHDQHYRGLGDGRFEEVSAKVGLKPERACFGLGVLTLDYDEDGDTDLYVANDSQPNFLFENQGDGTFREIGPERGAAVDGSGKEQASMGLAAADCDGDGYQDLFVTNFSGEENALYVSRARPRANGQPGMRISYRERASASGLGGPSRPLLGWGTSFADFDLDGLLDLCVFNGHVYPQADRAGTDTSYRQLDQLYRGQAGASGPRYAPEPLSDAAPGVSRASAALDLDGDGDLDLVAIGLDGAVRVLENRAQERAGGHWLRVALRSPKGNRHALGARVELSAGGRTLRAEVRSAGGYQAAVPAEVHFGLGPVQRIDELRVRWPSGREQKFGPVDANQRLALEEAGS
jgi:hypothetical protein